MAIVDLAGRPKSPITAAKWLLCHGAAKAKWFQEWGADSPIDASQLTVREATEIHDAIEKQRKRLAKFLGLAWC